MRTELFFLIPILFSNLSCQVQQIAIYTIGDSTMANYPRSRSPATGWGQVLQNYFSEDVTIYNHAVNGRSSKSFFDEGRWKIILNKLEKGDHVFIQFGHNDSKMHDPKRYTIPTTTYRHNLVRYIEETRSRGANPILLTSIIRRKYNDFGVLVDTHGLYPLMVREVSNSCKVPLIDLQLLTELIVNELGEEGSKEMYMWFRPGRYENYPSGKEDGTHLSEKGANMVAKKVADEIIKLNIELS